MTRKEIKRLLALLRAEAEGAAGLCLEVPSGFRESFENQGAFRGWANYHVTWDVDMDDAWLVVPLDQSRVSDWHDELRKVVPVLPGAES